MRRSPIIPGEIHHIYNRGVNYGDIFFNRENRLFFLRRLRHYCPPSKGEIVAYCLMPNHYHLLVTVRCEDFGPAVMQPLMVSYTKAINKQQGRVGPVFQGPFHNRAVKTDGDLIHLSRYIHLNPVTAGFVERPELWEFSSYADYVGLRDGTLPKPAAVMCHFPTPAAYAEFVNARNERHDRVVKELLIDGDE